MSLSMEGPGVSDTHIVGLAQCKERSLALMSDLSCVCVCACMRVCRATCARAGKLFPVSIE